MRAMVFLAVWVVACGDDEGPSRTDSSVDAAERDGAADAAAQADAALADSGNEGGQTNEGGVSDGSADGGVADGARGDGGACDDLRSNVESAREAAAACARSSQCAARYNPLCPLGGCYTFFAVGKDVSDLAAAEAAYAADCSGPSACDCAPPPDVLACVGGTCGGCPASCSYTCAMDCTCLKDACGCDQPACAAGTPDVCTDLQARMNEAVADLGGCRADEDCVFETSPLCPELGCYYGRHRATSTAQLTPVVAAFSAAGCASGAVCRCAVATGARCTEGQCEVTF